MNLPINYHGEPKGKLTVQKQGLYVLFSASCSFVPDTPLHLYAVSKMQSRPLGVLSRDGTAEKKLSAREAEPLPEAAVLGREENGFLPWCGTVAGETIPDAYLRHDGDKMTLAIPVEDGGEVPLLAFASQMEQQTVCGRPCLTLNWENGKPLTQPDPVIDEPEEAVQLDIQTEEFAEP